jgi:hypothetical protein
MISKKPAARVVGVLAIIQVNSILSSLISVVNDRQQKLPGILMQKFNHSGYQ